MTSLAQAYVLVGMSMPFLQNQNAYLVGVSGPYANHALSVPLEGLMKDINTKENYACERDIYIPSSSYATEKLRRTYYENMQIDPVLSWVKQVY